MSARGTRLTPAQAASPTPTPTPQTATASIVRAASLPVPRRTSRRPARVQPTTPCAATQHDQHRRRSVDEPDPAAGERARRQAIRTCAQKGSKTITRIWAQNSAVQGIGPGERHESTGFEDRLLERDRLRIAEHEPGTDVESTRPPARCPVTINSTGRTAHLNARASPSDGAPATADAVAYRAVQQAREHGHRHEEDRRRLDRVCRADQRARRECSAVARNRPCTTLTMASVAAAASSVAGGSVETAPITAHHCGINPRPPATVAMTSGSDVTVASSLAINHAVPIAMSSDTMRSRRSARCPAAGAGGAACWKIVGSVPPGLQARSRVEHEYRSRRRESGGSQHGCRADVIQRLLDELVRRRRATPSRAAARRLAAYPWSRRIVRTAGAPVRPVVRTGGTTRP